MPDSMGTDFAISSKTFEKLPNTVEKFSLPGSAEYATTQICSSSTPSRVTSQTLQVRPSTLSDLPVSATSTVRGVPLRPAPPSICSICARCSGGSLAICAWSCSICAESFFATCSMVALSNSM